MDFSPFSVYMGPTPRKDWTSPYPEVPPSTIPYPVPYPVAPPSITFTTPDPEVLKRLDEIKLEMLALRKEVATLSDQIKAGIPARPSKRRTRK